MDAIQKEIDDRNINDLLSGPLLHLCLQLNSDVHVGTDNDQGKDIYTCNGCQRNDARWHCNTCDDFDFCNDCNKTVTHPHKLEENCTLVDNDSSAQSGDANAQDQDRNESIQRCIQSLVHACQCRDANCRRLSCHKMKRLVQHTRACRKRQGGNCPVCKQLIAFCCYHAKHCLDAHCQVLFCQQFRQMLNDRIRHLAHSPSTAVISEENKA